MLVSALLWFFLAGYMVFKPEALAEIRNSRAAPASCRKVRALGSAMLGAPVGWLAGVLTVGVWGGSSRLGWSLGLAVGVGIAISIYLVAAVLFGGASDRG